MESALCFSYNYYRSQLNMTGDIQMKERIGNDYRHTIYACYIGFVTQAVVINFAPLLFVRFGVEFDIPLENFNTSEPLAYLEQWATNCIDSVLRGHPERMEGIQLKQQ